MATQISRSPVEKIKKMATMTAGIYLPAGIKKNTTTFSIDEISELASYLKKNRVLYHVLKENEPLVRSSNNESLNIALAQGDEHFSKLKNSLSELNQMLGSSGYQTFKTFFKYPRLTSDLDIIVKYLLPCAKVLDKNGWKNGIIQQGTMDVEKDNAITIGLHEKVGWDTPSIFDEELLWANLRNETLVGEHVLIPSPELDLITILAHVPFEKLYIDWGEMCYLYVLAQSADLKFVMRQAVKYNWDRSLKSMLSVLNLAHRVAFDSPSPFESIWPKVSSIELTLPYECSMSFAALSLIEIGAWKKFFGIVFDFHRMGHFFRGRTERQQITV